MKTKRKRRVGATRGPSRPEPSKRLAAKPRRKPRRIETRKMALASHRRMTTRTEQAEKFQPEQGLLLGAKPERKPQQTYDQIKKQKTLQYRAVMDDCARRRRSRAIRKGAILAAGKGGKGNLRKGVKKSDRSC